MQTIYGELCEVIALVQTTDGDLVEMTSLVATPTPNKALLAFMEVNHLHATQIINSNVRFVRYVICAI
jgi:hypothetical protein